MNIDNINMTIDAILSAREHQFDMETWRKGGDEIELINHGCGTVACIGGWAQAVAVSRGELHHNCSEQRVQDWLGLDRAAFNALCFGPGVREGITQLDAAKVLRLIVTDGVVDWSIIPIVAEAQPTLRAVPANSEPEPDDE